MKSRKWGAMLWPVIFVAFCGVSCLRASDVDDLLVEDLLIRVNEDALDARFNSSFAMRFGFVRGKTSSFDAARQLCDEVSVQYDSFVAKVGDAVLLRCEQPYRSLLAVNQNALVIDHEKDVIGFVHRDFVRDESVLLSGYGDNFLFSAFLQSVGTQSDLIEEPLQDVPEGYQIVSFQHSWKRLGPSRVQYTRVFVGQPPRATITDDFVFEQYDGQFRLSTFEHHEATAAGVTPAAELRSVLAIDDYVTCGVGYVPLKLKRTLYSSVSGSALFWVWEGDRNSLQVPERNDLRLNVSKDLRAPVGLASFLGREIVLADIIAFGSNASTGAAALLADPGDAAIVTPHPSFGLNTTLFATFFVIIAIMAFVFAIRKFFHSR